MLSKYKDQLSAKGELYLRLKIRPGASRNMVRELMADNTIKIDIAAPPLRGRANEELIRFLAGEFSVSRKNVIILSGAGEKIKLVKIIS